MSNQASTPLSGSAESSRDGRLDSWKEIAAYLRREVRTVQRWEKSAGLPVHRLQTGKQGPVYAFKAELDAWYSDRRPELESDSADQNTRSKFDIRRIRPRAVAAAAPILLALMLGLNLGGLRDRLLRRADAGRIRSLAVLPLENLSGDPSQDYFADGMTEALITDLGKIRELRVISRTSVMQYKGKQKRLGDVAQELRVDAVIEGSVARTEGRVRVTANLIEASTDRHLWAEIYDRDLHDVLSVQSEFAEAIAREVQAKLTTQEHARISHVRRVDPEAHELYLRGRFFWNKRSPEAVKKSIEYFEQAIAKDPYNALAYSGLADSYNVISSFNLLPPKEAFPKAREAATKAIQLDESLAEAHTSLAVVKAAYEWDWPDAEREYKRAIELNPGYANAHYWYAFTVLTRLGRFEEAIAEMNRALELDPFSLIINTNLGWIFYYAHRYDDALEQCRKVLDLDSTFASAHVRMVQAYEQKGMFDHAIAETEKLIPLRKEERPEDIDALWKAYRTSGAKGYWRQRLGSVQGQFKHHYVSPAFVASIYASLGEKEQAFSWLEHAYAERDNWLTYLKVDPRFDTLQLDPRFHDLLRRVGLPS
jgi:TolB-like protein/tetratricopeptide (TPR) repeat protein